MSVPAGGGLGSDLAGLTIYAVWWRSAGEKNFGDGPMHWVGAWSSIDDAREAQRRVGGNWIDTGILELQVDNDLPEGR